MIVVKLTIFRKYFFELILGFAIAAILVYAALIREFTVGGGAFTYPSLISYALCFALTSYFLNRQGLKFLERIFYCFATMASGIVLFEIAYHYGFLAPSLEYVWVHDFTFLSTQSTNGNFSLIWYLIIFSLPFIGRKYMALNKIFLAVFFFGGFVFLFWMAIGYPQFLYPQWWSSSFAVIKIIPTNNPASEAYWVKVYGELFNGISKIIAIEPALLFNKK